MISTSLEIAMSEILLKVNGSETWIVDFLLSDSFEMFILWFSVSSGFS